MAPGYETILFEVGEDHVATLTLNRPEQLNSFTERMAAEVTEVWEFVRDTDTVHSVVLRASGERAFCTGIDIKAGRWWGEQNVWNQVDPGAALGPKHHKVWKPVVAAVHGMCAGGAFYWINECDIVIGSEDATFFDPHVTYGMTSALEPIGMTYKMPLGDVLRMVLLGNDERISAHSALRMGIISEVVPLDALWDRARHLASIIAAKPSAATAGSVKAIWESLDLPRSVALATGLKYCLLGNAIGVPQVNRETLMADKAKKFEVR